MLYLFESCSRGSTLPCSSERPMSTNNKWRKTCHVQIIHTDTQRHNIHFEPQVNSFNVGDYLCFCFVWCIFTTEIPNCVSSKLYDCLFLWILFRCFGAYFPWPILYIHSKNDIDAIIEKMIPEPMNNKQKARLRQLIGWLLDVTSFGFHNSSKSQTKIDISETFQC